MASKMAKQKTALRVQKYRNTLRASGFRPIQIWVPDTRRRGFQQECRKQSLLLRHDTQEHEVLDFISSVFDHEGWK